MLENILEFDAQKVCFSNFEMMLFRTFFENAPKSVSKCSEKGAENGRKCVFFRVFRPGKVKKSNFFLLIVSELRKKTKKSAWQVNNDRPKALFLRSQLRGKRGLPAETKGR